MRVAVHRDARQAKIISTFVFVSQFTTPAPADESWLAVYKLRSRVKAGTWCDLDGRATAMTLCHHTMSVDVRIDAPVGPGAHFPCAHGYGHAPIEYNLR
jgi:hypothetical protein